MLNELNARVEWENKAPKIEKKKWRESVLKSGEAKKSGSSW